MTTLTQPLFSDLPKDKAYIGCSDRTSQKSDIIKRISTLLNKFSLLDEIIFLRNFIHILVMLYLHIQTLIKCLHLNVFIKFFLLSTSLFNIPVILLPFKEVVVNCFAHVCSLVGQSVRRQTLSDQ